MKRANKQILSKIVVALTGLLLLPAWIQAQPVVAGHYPAGAEGIKGASLPPPGIYFRDYNFFYGADKFADGPPQFDVFAYINAPRLIWMTDLKIFGANYGMDIIVPFGYMDWNVMGSHDSDFQLGDIQVEPLLLSWHLKQFDVACGYAFWAPTGDYDPNQPDLISKGFWSHMLTAGAVWYPDTAKTWALSLLNRYEFCMQQEDTDIDPGQVYTLEWGFSKNLEKTIDVGLIGYYQQQTTKDTGATATDKLDRKVGIGPEISVFFPKAGLFLSARYAYEFGAVERPEGQLGTLTLTKMF